MAAKSDTHHGSGRQDVDRKHSSTGRKLMSTKKLGVAAVSAAVVGVGTGLAAPAAEAQVYCLNNFLPNGGCYGWWNNQMTYSWGWANTGYACINGLASGVRLKANKCAQNIRGTVSNFWNASRLYPNVWNCNGCHLLYTITQVEGSERGNGSFYGTRFSYGVA
jgi:hypothetical protein